MGYAHTLVPSQRTPTTEAWLRPLGERHAGELPLAWTAHAGLEPEILGKRRSVWREIARIWSLNQINDAVKLATLSYIGTLGACPKCP